MERIGDDNELESLDVIRAALQACECAPVGIQRGAVVKMAKALEDMLSDYKDASDGWDAENQEIAIYIINSAEAALLAYYGGTEHGD